MVDSESKLFASKDSWTSLEKREKQRIKLLSELGLRQPETIPVFEEATQSAAHFLETPISILGFIDQEIHWFKSAVGLFRLGLMNSLAQNRQMSRRESFCQQVVENCHTLVISDTENIKDPTIVESPLVQIYGIRAYVGVPLIDASGHCLGALEIMDLVPRNFTTRDIEFLQIIARWSMSEFERNRLAEKKPEKTTAKTSKSVPDFANAVNLKIAPPIIEKIADSSKQIKLQLLNQLTQELRTPLTSILGMAGVLGREIYGPLTTKQREYLEVIQHSGQSLLSLVNEITELDVISENFHLLNLVPVDIEMLCQQAIKMAEEAANRREHKINLTLEETKSCLCSLDKDKVRQMLYHLLSSVISISPKGSIIKIHVSYKNQDKINITLSVSHPVLGAGIMEFDPYFAPKLEFINDSTNENLANQHSSSTTLENSPKRLINDSLIDLAKLSGNESREQLSLLLSFQLAELHGGKILIQASEESGYRYVVSLPQDLRKN